MINVIFSGYDVYDTTPRGLAWSARVAAAPEPRLQLAHLVIRHAGQALQHVAQILERVDTPPAAAFHQREEDRPGLPCALDLHGQNDLLLHRKICLLYTSPSPRD